MRKEPTNEHTLADHKKHRVIIERGARKLVEGNFSLVEGERNKKDQISNLVDYVFLTRKQYSPKGVSQETYKGVKLETLAEALLYYIGKRHMLLLHQTLGKGDIQKYINKGWVRDPSEEGAAISYFEGEFSSWHETAHFLVAYLARKGDPGNENGIAPAYYEEDRNKMNVISKYGGSRSLLEERLTTMLGPAILHEDDDGVKLTPSSLYTYMRRHSSKSYAESLSTFLDEETRKIQDSVHHFQELLTNTKRGGGEISVVERAEHNLAREQADLTAWQNYADAIMEKVTRPHYTPHRDTAHPLEDIIIDLAHAAHNSHKDDAASWFSVLEKYYDPLFAKALSQFQLEHKV